MTETVFYPVGIHGTWKEPSESPPLNPLLRDWLLNTGSLTERLQACCRSFKVQLLGQQVADLTEDEADFLFHQFGNDVEKTQVREVFLLGDNCHWVFARSLLPSSFLNSEMDELTRLGQQPLGKIIFNDQRFVRQGFQLVQCPADSATLRKLRINTELSCWGRRSLFKFKHYRIMVAEVFLPGSPAYANYQG